MTHRWLERCLTQNEKSPLLYDYAQTFFPIVQGSVYKDLRTQSAEYIASKGAEGNAIGGLSVGEPAEEMYGMNSNIFSLGPNVVVSQNEFTKVNQFFTDHGLTVEGVAYKEVSKMGGLLRCSTLPLSRL